MTIKTSAKKSVQLLVNHCVQVGMTHVVISPGSRSAPLVIAFNQHPEITCLVVPDERSAAFIALGIAQQQQRGVGLVCTSGSAPLNYYPAIAEAYYQRIPLVVMTADRPLAWVNQGDGQTIVQQDVFKQHIDYFVQIDDQMESEEYTWYLRREMASAFAITLGKSKGPVHFNVSLSEPLYEITEIQKHEFPPLSFQHPVTMNTLTQEERERINNSWVKMPKKLLLCGQLIWSQSLKEELIRVSQDPSVLVLVENTSNLVDDKFIHCIDRLLNSIPDDEFPDFQPDLLLTLGGAIISKRVKTFLRKHPPKEHWKISYDFPFMDTYQSLSHSYEMDGASFLKELTAPDSASLQVGYQDQWRQKETKIRLRQQAFFKETRHLCDITAFGKILDSLPVDSHLHMANSSVVRYCQLFDPTSKVRYWSNRGTSGIDGSSSTAVGSAYSTPETSHVLITGDLSFFYDSNAFWNHLKVPNLKIFLINNGGGGIFKIIPGPGQTEELEDFFVFNNKPFSAKDICKAFHLSYYNATSLTELDEQLTPFYKEKQQVAIMEVFTSGISNETELKKYFDFVKV